MNLIGQSAVICLSFSGLCRMLLQLQCYQKPQQFKKCRIVVPQAQTLLASLIILVDLTMLILSDKLLLDIQLNHTFMPKMIHKPWMVYNGQSIVLRSPCISWCSYHNPRRVQRGFQSCFFFNLSKKNYQFKISHEFGNSIMNLNTNSCKNWPNCGEGNNAMEQRENLLKTLRNT